MLGVDSMSTREANIALISTFSEDVQQQIFVYLTNNFCDGNPYKPKSAEEIYAELAQSRDSYEHGDVIDFDIALDEIDKKYGL